MTTKAEMRELADDLEMLANQIRESTEDHRNQPPSPWTLDDWKTRYESAYEALRK